MELETRIAAIVKASRTWLDPDYPSRVEAVQQTLELDNRFTFESVTFAINQQLSQLRPDRLRKWIGEPFDVSGVRIGALVAGNIPFVGLQDFVATVVSGGSYRGATSSRSPILLKRFGEHLTEYYDADVQFFAGPHEGRLDWLVNAADAVIATGDADTTAVVAARCLSAGIERMLLRKSTFSIAVLDGSESDEELEGLAEDAFLHDGLGCRSVAVIFAPEGFAVDPFLRSANHFRRVFPAHGRTVVELRRQAALLQAVNLPCAFPDDYSFLISRGEPDSFGAGHVRWTTYEDVSDVAAWISDHQSELQLVACTDRVQQELRLPSGIDVARPGDSQRPSLDWAPDGNSVIAFLRSISGR